VPARARRLAAGVLHPHHAAALRDRPKPLPVICLLRNFPANAQPQGSHPAVRALADDLPAHPKAEARTLDLAKPAIVTVGSVASDASPTRKDFTDALEKALHAVYPGVPIIPAVASGASDSMWFRQFGTPSYGAGPTFIKDARTSATA
jgi:hypothetical protein